MRESTAPLYSGSVRRDYCYHSISDQVSPPRGIGKCDVDAPYIENDPPRWPMTQRVCKKFAPDFEDESAHGTPQ